MKTIGIIPARYASSRFPGKLLADLNGQSILQRVHAQAQKANRLDEVIIATDDERILAHAQSFGANAVMTRADHVSGTDRCAEVAEGLPEDSIIVNIQGDEPFIAPEQINLVARPLARSNRVFVSTLAKKITDPAALHNPNTVKVIMGDQGKALYFSRSALPHRRGIEPGDWLQHGTYYKHIGLYAFPAPLLKELAQLPPSTYEQAEALEQLRWLEAGHTIQVTVTKQETIGIDTPADLEEARQKMR